MEHLEIIATESQTIKVYEIMDTRKIKLFNQLLENLTSLHSASAQGYFKDSSARVTCKQCNKEYPCETMEMVIAYFTATKGLK